MNEKIKSFLNENSLLCWAMQDDDGVYCANAFYAFDDENLSLIIASHENTRHIELARQNPRISVNVAKFGSVASLKGIQIKAIFDKASKVQSKLYYARFPFARLKGGSCFALCIHYAKFTDNALGKKLEFRRTQGDE
mgnify:CR=1 FL=1